LGKSLEFYRVRVNDVNCDYVIATGDCNDNQECVNSIMKRICTLYSLEQLITDPTNFAEHSSSILDLIVTNSIDFVPYTGVIPPLLDRIRYHCPVFGIINCPINVSSVKYGCTMVVTMINTDDFYQTSIGIY
jgi:hypothetical protein